MRLNSRSQNSLAIALPAWAILMTLTFLGPFSGRPEAQEKKFEDFDPNNFGNSTGTALKTSKPRTTAQPTAKVTAKGPKITEEEAVKIALKAVPGEVTGVAIEKKLGADRYVVEVLAKEDGVETDVIIDMETGKVLATEK